MIQIPEFTSKELLFRWIKTNKHIIITEKKSQLKRADAVSFGEVQATAEGITIKSEPTDSILTAAEFPVKVVINTTNIRDSHKDVHLPGIWKKSLQEAKLIYLLQEHEMKFDHIISDQVTATTKSIKWKDLGQKWEGSTEALIFDATITREDNPEMAKAYAKGKVKNHSVGMQYVKLELAMNSSDKFDKEEKAVWDKYIDQIVNKEEVEQDGYFWAVTEAKVIEGSAVPMGSNFVTPTISVGEQPKSLNSADTITEPEPMQWGKLAEAFKQSKS